MSVTQDLFGELRIMWTGDPWGDGMHWFFTVAEELFERGVALPEEWRFRPSPLGNTNDPDDYATMTVKDVDDENLLRFGRALSRYLNKVKAAGKDY